MMPPYNAVSRKRTVAHGSIESRARSRAIKKNRLQAHNSFFKISYTMLRVTVYG